jgi:hypothetical protein
MMQYIHMYDHNDRSVDRVRWFPEQGNVVPGIVIQRSVNEGYIPYTVTAVTQWYADTNVIGWKAVVEAGEYVKTHCKHDWVIDGKSIQLGNHFQFLRHCDKCQQKQGYNIGKATWEQINER